MGAGGQKFGLLMWKNFKLQIRSPWTTVFQILIPVLLFTVFVGIRAIIESNYIANPTEWNEFPIGTWPTPQDNDTEVLELPVNGTFFVAFTPNNTATKAIMDRLPFKLLDFATEESMTDFLISNSNVSKLTLGGVTFVDWGQDLNYKLRLPSKARVVDARNWHTGSTFPEFSNVGPRAKDSTTGLNPGYYEEAFLALQFAINDAFLQGIVSQNMSSAGVDMYMRRHPYPPYTDDFFVTIVQSQLPFFLCLGTIIFAFTVVKNLVHEKERKLKESMKMMGLPGWMHWMAWFTKEFIVMLIPLILMVVLLNVKVKGASVINYTNVGVLFVFLLLYLLTGLFFCFMVSTLFSKANTAAAAGGFLYFILYVFYFFVPTYYTQLNRPIKMLISLDFQIAMGLGARLIGQFEGIGAGIQWSTLNSPISKDDDLSMLHIWIMFIIDSIIFILITWYVEAVKPGEFGVPEKWYFCCTKSYWCGVDEADADFSPIDVDQSFFEKDPTGRTAGIQIRNLRKDFGRGEKKKVAVNNMNLNMYQGQVTVLLGHNGAGKTTTMSMLTGMIPPSKGTALVNNYDIRRHIKNVRESLGLCPQHDVLFDDLTVKEHLTFFAKLKGVPSSQVQTEVMKYVKELHIEEKLNFRAKQLSGGQKRKLSIGIALIGDSKVVILDEPTSGLDPSARRQIWDVLQSNKAGRTMLLTTHFMDEADILGDRIAIMAEGVVKCCGSSFFLKSKYGAGYHMVLVKKPDCHVPRITQFIQDHVPQAVMESNVSAELTFLLPTEASGKFEEMFTTLEERREELGISSYGASITTMEEVFIKVGADQDDVKDRMLQDGKVDTKQTLPLAQAADGGIDMAPDVFSSSQTYNRGATLWCQQFWGMFIKRAIHSLRNIVLSVAQLLVPVIFTVLALAAIKYNPRSEDSPELLLDLEPFESPEAPYWHGNSSLSSSLAQDIGKSYSNLVAQHATAINVSNTAHDGSLGYLIAKAEESLGVYTRQQMVALDAFPEGARTKVVSWFNNEAFHTPAIALSLAFNSILQSLTNASFSITTSNHPQPRSTDDQVNQQTGASSLGFTFAFTFLIGAGILTGTFCLFIIKERTTKAKLIQVVSGVSPATYWLSTFVWDLINYLIPCIIVIILFYAFDIKEYEDERAGVILLILILHGVSALPMTYLMSFIFSVPATGLVWISIIQIFLGLVATTTVSILRVPGLNETDTAKDIEWVGNVLLPQFNLGIGLMDVYSNYQNNELCGSAQVQAFCASPFVVSNPCCPGKCGDACASFTDSYLSWETPGVGRPLAFMAVQALVFFFFIFLIDYGVIMKLFYLCRGSSNQRSGVIAPKMGVVNGAGPAAALGTGQDEDVEQERQRVREARGGLGCSEALVLSDITKYYGGFEAVKALTVAVPQGECFGLLGVNGAGKTSTFKMLTGDEHISSGTAFIDGFDIRKDMKKVQRRVGYCPQFDALIDQMTGRETLTMFCRLRGVPERNIKSAVNTLMHLLSFTQHADKQTRKYSGGNKRKLSTAIALVGGPPVVLLDEPTTGMDPVARRMLWDTLGQAREAGRTLVLTSHSMEECEALCTKIGIMVNGQFRCLGPTQHLKNKFGQGYTLIARAKVPDEGFEINMQPFMDFIQAQFPGAVLKDVHQTQVHYHIPNPSVSWGKVFGTLERHKEQFLIEDYSVSQTTLEQVFISFARSQVPPRETKKGCCRRLCCCCCSS